jgi:methyltransferase family protein
MSVPEPDDPGCACAVGNEFGAKSAERDLRAYRRNGPDRTTRWLLEGLGGADQGSVEGLTVLDVGAGIGAVHLGLLAAGAAAAVDVDGSPAYVAVARGEADRAGVGDRVTYLTGDFVELAPGLEPADLVALDRVVCCYPDMRALVARSAALARRRYGLVYPRDRWWIRGGSATFNAFLRLFRRRLRFHVHPTVDVEAVASEAGLTRVHLRQTVFWQVAVFERHT